MAAAALAVVLSGAPRLAMGRTVAATGTCHCRRDLPARPCSCPKHRGQGSSASQHGPECRGHARKAAAPASDAPGAVAASCLNTCCGGSEDRAPPPSGTDLFTVPASTGIAYVSGSEPVPAASPRKLQRGREPDVPPPRAA